MRTAAAVLLALIVALPVFAASRHDEPVPAFAPVLAPDRPLDDARCPLGDGSGHGYGSRGAAPLDVPCLSAVRPASIRPRLGADLGGHCSIAGRPCPDRRGLVPIPSPHLIVIDTVPRAAGSSSPSTSGRTVRGVASWFCGHGSACTVGYPSGSLAAAAGPALRVGNWRGRVVTVRANGRSVNVRLVDWCACPRRVMDLYRAAFSRLADPSRGLVKVTVTW